jgi:energy-coupling factor transporter ATP-binding protein EcfA2
MEGGAAIEVAGLRVRYPGEQTAALEDVTFSVAHGELVGVLGLNGAGKTTLCRCMDGIVPQLVEAEVEGAIHVAGIDVRGRAVGDLASLIAVVLDAPRSQLSQGTVGEEVAFGLESLAVPHDEMVRRVDDALARVGLDGLADRSPDTLSGGEQQRLVIACAVAMRPRVLILDEPMAGLDPAGRETIIALLAALAADDGTAVLLVDHDVELLAEHADRILVLDGGRLVADGTPQMVLGGVTGAGGSSGTGGARVGGTGLRIPDVTAVAAGLVAKGVYRSDGPLPVTVDDAVSWFATARR